MNVVCVSPHFCSLNHLNAHPLAPHSQRFQDKSLFSASTFVTASHCSEPSSTVLKAALLCGDFQVVIITLMEGNYIGSLQHGLIKPNCQSAREIKVEKSKQHVPKARGLHLRISLCSLSNSAFRSDYFNLIFNLNLIMLHFNLCAFQVCWLMGCTASGKAEVCIATVVMLWGTLLCFSFK